MENQSLEYVEPSAVQWGEGYSLPSEMTTSQYLRALIVLVQFKDDAYQRNDWPLNQEPSNWMGLNMADETVTQNSTNYNLTHYYTTMSMGKFKFIANTVYVITSNTRQEYINMNYARREINKQILESLSGEINWTNYDNWTKTGLFNQSWGKDGYVDMVVFVYRNVALDKTNPSLWESLLDFSGYTAIAELGGGSVYSLDKNYIDPDFTYRNSGVTIGHSEHGLDWTRNNIIHEIGHHFLGSGNHTKDGAWGMLSNWGCRSQMINAYERDRLGWGTKLQYSYNPATPITLPDYISTGTYLKIIVPGSSPASCYYLENHQRIAAFDNIDKTSGGQGVYVINQTNLASGDYTYFYNAQGKYNWTLYDRESFPIYGDGLIDVVLRGKQNKLGTFDTDPIPVGTYSPIHAYRDTINHTSVPDALFLGDGLDAMKPGYVDVMTPYGNPPVSNVSFQVISVNNEIKVKQFVEAGTLTGSVPSRPLNLDVQVVNNYAYLNWDASTEPDVVGSGSTRGIYKIYRGTATVPQLPTTFSYIGYVTHPTTSYTDDQYYLTPLYGNKKVYYKVSVVDITGLESTKSEYDSARYNPEIQKQLTEVIKYSYKLENNYPNPFNPNTTITFEIPNKEYVELKVYDMLGKEVAELVNGYKEAGSYTVNFDANNLASGLYIYKLKTSNYNKTKKMLLLK